MACSSCNNNTPLVFDVQSFLNPTCNSCGDSQCFPAKNVCYTGPDLPCSGVLTNDTLDDALTKIDEQICSASGDYSSYQKNCLPDWAGNNLDTEALFVEAITGYACETRTNLDEFLQDTFPVYQIVVDERFDNIELPAITCASVGIVNTDTLTNIYTKYCSKFTSIDSALNMSSVDFGVCYTVVDPPVTVKEGFEEVISQICNLKSLIGSGGVTLPTFNNVGTCLASPLTSTDSLESTVIKIRTKLCTLPTWDKTLVTWGCVGLPTTSTLEDAIQKVVTKVNYILPKTVTFGSGFTVAPTNISDPCDGVTVSLGAITDRYVASNNTDVTPGTLKDKLLGTGITINDATAGKITLISDFTVKGSSGDTTPGALIDKLNGSSTSGFTITPTYNGTTKKVDLILTVDPDAICALFANCAAAQPCTSYTVTPAGSSALSYTDCSGSIVNITISGVTVICAKLNTVYAPNATIVNSGACATGCYAPVTLTSSAITSSSFIETWSAVTDATDYQYRINGGSWISNGLSLTVTVGAVPSTLYTFDVRAEVNSITCSEFTSNVVTTPPASSNNLLIENLVAGLSVDSSDLVGGAAYYFVNVGTTPLTTGQSLEGVHGDFSGQLQIEVSGSFSPSTAKVYVDGVLRYCLDITSAGSYAFTTDSYITAEQIDIRLDEGTCGV